MVIDLSQPTHNSPFGVRAPGGFCARLHNHTCVVQALVVQITASNKAITGGGVPNRSDTQTPEVPIAKVTAAATAVAAAS
jgi:hypothetical protein